MDVRRNSTPPTAYETFESAWGNHHRYLEGLASRMLGDPAEAEDVVQDAFDRLSRTRLDEILDVRGWLAVVVRRLCLARLRSAYSRREMAAGPAPPDVLLDRPGHGRGDPADRITLDDQVRFALAILLDRLSPAERTAFVLHDVFGFHFDSVGEIIGRSSTACRQLASRARRSVRLEDPLVQSDLELTDHHSILSERFIAACAGGDLAELMALLHPGILGEATLQGYGTVGHLEGSRAVATTLLERFGPGTDTTLVPVPLDGQPGIVALANGYTAGLLKLETVDGVVRHIRTFIRRPS